MKLWEKEMAGARPFSLQTSLLILGVGVVAFLVSPEAEMIRGQTIVVDRGPDDALGLVLAVR